MNRIKKLSLPVSFTLLLVTLSAMYSASVFSVSYFNAENMVAENGYEYYRAWSQDQYPWHDYKPSDAWENAWMNLYGCSTVAMAKMFVESGVADPYSFNPGTLMSDYGSPSKGIGDVGIYWSTLASQFGMECESYQCYPNGSFYSTALDFFKRSDKQYHLLLKVIPASGGSHYLQVDRQATLAAGELILNNSTNTYDGTARYSSADEYFQNVSLKKLTDTNYYADYFVVFSHKDAVQLKSVEDIDNQAVKLTWYPNGACQKYIIYRREKGDDTWTGKRIATVKASAGEGLKTYTDKTASYSKEYEYTVRGCYSSYSGTTYLKYDKKGLYITLSSPAPNLKSAESTDHKTVKLSWEKSPTASAYRVYRKQTGSSWTILQKKTTGTSFTDATAECGVKYTYTVRGFDKETAKLGAWNKKGISVTPVPKAVTLKKTSSVDFNKIKVTWKKLDDMDGYALYRKSSTDKKFKKIAETEGVDSTVETDESTLTGEAYTYTVRAYKTVDGKNIYGKYNEKGIIGKSYTQAPVILNTVSTQSDSLKLHWSQVNGATGYIIYRSTSPDGSYVKAGKSSGNGSTSFVDKGLECCVKYYYKVKGFRERSGKNYSGYTSSAFYGNTQPAAPGITKAESENYKTIKLQWKRVDQATSYIVYRRDSDSLASIKNLNGDVNTYKDNTVKTGVEYNYSVRAVCAKNGMVAYSNYSQQISAKAYPSTPSLVKAESSSYDEIDFQWSEVGGSTGYVVYRKLPTDKNYSTLNVVNGQKNVTYKDQSVVCGQKYSYTVKSYRNVDGISYYSDNCNGITATAKPATPEVEAECANYNTINVSWTKIKGADGYRVYYIKGKGEKWSKLGTFNNGDLTSCTHTSLETGTPYRYTVRAFRKEGSKTIWSDCLHDGASATPITSAAKLISAKPSAYNAVTIKWEASEGVNGYRVYRKATSDTKWTALKTLSEKKLKYTDNTAVCGTTYKYTVRGYRNVDNKKVFGLYDKKGLSATPRPNAPKATLTATGYNKIKLKWKVCEGADGYRIYRKAQGGSFELIKDIDSAATTSYKDKVECGVLYTYYLISYANVNGKLCKSAKSESYECKAVPNTPVLVSAVSSKTASAQITWNKVSGASGYYIYRKDSKGEFKLIFDNMPGSNCSFTDTTVTSGETYTYTVSAFRICTAGYIEGGYDTNGLSVKIK